MFSVVMLGLLITGQTIEFDQYSGLSPYASTYGSSADVVAFYQDWKRNVDPHWERNAAKWWNRHDERILPGLLRWPSKRTSLAYEFWGWRHFWPFWKTVCHRNCTIVIRGSLDPFGKFTLFISPRIVGFVVVGILVIDLVGLGIWIRYWFLRKAVTKDGR